MRGSSLFNFSVPYLRSLGLWVSTCTKTPVSLPEVTGMYEYSLSGNQVHSFSLDIFKSMVTLKHFAVWLASECDGVREQMRTRTSVFDIISLWGMTLPPKAWRSLKTVLLFTFLSQKEQHQRICSVCLLSGHATFQYFISQDPRMIHYHWALVQMVSSAGKQRN